MALLKEECGHPTEWNLRVVQNGKKYTYCIGCIVEKIELDNLEAYSNPYINLNKNTTTKKTKVVIEATTADTGVPKEF